MKRVLIYRQATAIGGAERYLLSLLEHSKKRFRYEVVTDLPELENAVRLLNVPCVRSTFSWEPFGRRAVIAFLLHMFSDRRRLLQEIPRFFGKEKGVVYCHSLTDKLLVSRAAKQAGHRVVWIEHGPMIGRLLKSKIILRWYRHSSKYVDKIICVSNTTSENIATAVSDPRKLTVVYNGTGAIRRGAGSSGSATHLVTTNRLSPEKGYFELFAVLKKLIDLPWHLDVVGTGPAEDEIRARADQLGLTDRISFQGFQVDVRPFLSRADVYVNSTIYPGEGLPISNIEALSAGLAVVTSGYGGAIETVEDGVSGLVVDPLNNDQFCETLQTVMTDRSLRKRLGTAAVKRYAELFSIEKMVAATEKVLS